MGGIYQVAGPAAILGLNKSVFIYQSNSTASLIPEWQFGCVSLPKGIPIYRTSYTLGIEVDATAYHFGITGGLFSQAVGEMLPESGRLTIIYDPNHKNTTYVQVSNGK